MVAQNEQMKQMKLELYFVLGTSSNGQDSLLTERQAIDDMVVGDFIDSYRNLTLKTLTAHTFLNSTYFRACQPEWVVFHDDDTFVNYSKVLRV